MGKPLVSICCITYNHEPYIKDALDGFVMQKTNFPFEIVISDDCSTDGTRNVIEEYKAKYTGLIRDVSPIENKGMHENFSYVQQLAQGKYIAFCEGDDYWTDPYKLQKQADFMEAHPECSVSFHRYDILQQEEQIWRKDRCDKYLKQGNYFVELTLSMYFAEWVTQPCTMMYRKGVYIGEDKPYHGYKDQHMIFHLLNEGTAYILNFKGAVYRENRGGIHGRTPLLSQTHLAVHVAQELYDLNGKTKVLRENLIRTLDWAIKCEKRSNEGNVGTLLSYVLCRLVVSKSLSKTLKRLLKN